MPSVSSSTGPSTSKATPRSNEDAGNWMETFLGKDGIPTDTTKQMIMGGVSGWITGFLAMKGMKVAATAIGGGIIILQIASHQGYININWNRLRRDMNDATTKIVEGGDQKKKDWTGKLESKFDKLANRAEDAAVRLESKSKRWYNKLAGRESQDLHIFLSSFAVGTLVGIVSGGL